LRTLVATDGEGTDDVGKHLLDETAEFKMPNLGRHAAEDNEGLEATQRFDPGFGRRSQPPVPNAQDVRDR
jgi:hypothetical protein